MMMFGAMGFMMEFMVAIMASMMGGFFSLFMEPMWVMLTGQWAFG